MYGRCQPFFKIISIINTKVCKFVYLRIYSMIFMSSDVRWKEIQVTSFPLISSCNRVIIFLSERINVIPVFMCSYVVNYDMVIDKTLPSSQNYMLSIINKKFFNI